MVLSAGEVNALAEIDALGESFTTEDEGEDEGEGEGEGEGDGRGRAPRRGVGLDVEVGHRAEARVAALAEHLAHGTRYMARCTPYTMHTTQ